MNASNRRTIILHVARLALLVALVAGCGKSSPKEAAVDVEPFKKAIAEYLERNNMAMAVKEMKEGPVVTGAKATLTASLAHATMGGPTVTWEFTLEKGGTGAWKVVSRKP